MRFVELLLVATTVTGSIWVIDKLFFKPRRLMNVLWDRASTTSGPQDPWWVDYAKSFFPVLLIVLLLRSFVGEPFRIPSGSMNPTLIEGDFIFVNKYAYGLRLPFWGTRLLPVGQPKRGDIVVFKHDTKQEDMDVIKRVIALPGDHIQYRDQKIILNGAPLQTVFEQELSQVPDPVRGGTQTLRQFREDLSGVQHAIFLREQGLDALGQHYPYEDLVVPPNSYFVMGDNRDNSKDSRMWGLLKEEDLQGRAVAIWMSVESARYWWWPRWPRWERLTLHLQ